VFRRDQSTQEKFPMDKKFEPLISGSVLTDAEKAAIAAENRRAAETVDQVSGAGVVGVDHLIDACGRDPQKLAGLALLLASSSLAFGMMGRRDANTLEQIRLFQRAAVEIQKRLSWELHR
jgi:hypothetical protein